MNFETIFDVTNAGYRTWHFAVVGFVGIFCGILAIKPTLWPKRLPALTISSPNRVFSYFVLIFSMFWTILAFSISYSHHISAVAAMSSGQVQIVEGRISNFIAETNKNKQESFQVNGIHFRYSRSLVTEGYRGTAAQGDVLKNGLNVRIAYWDGLILRLEIAP